MYTHSNIIEWWLPYCKADVYSTLYELFAVLFEVTCMSPVSIFLLKREIKIVLIP